MVLAKIQENIEGYKRYLQQTRRHEGIYMWETLQHFQMNWNPEAADPAGMFDRCLQNSENRRQWQDGNWQPKRMLMEFWAYQPATVRAMFADLYNEQFAAENRVSRFVFGCDALLADYKKDHPRTIENNHYHGDYRAPALYLSLYFPEKYAPYDFDIFRAALLRLGARDIPEVNDVGRFFKVMRTLKTFLDKDPGIDAGLRKHLRPHVHFSGACLLPVVDYCRYVASV